MSSVASLVSALGGVASCRELAEYGHPAADVTRAVRTGSVLRVRNGWVAVPTGAPENVVAAVRAGGTLSCLSALAPLTVWTADDARRHIRIRRHGVAPPAAAGVVVHRALPLVGLQSARGGVDSPEWAIAHAVLCQGRRDAVATLDSAIYRGVITRRRLESVLAQLPRRYSDLLLLCNPEAESGLETHLRLLLRSVGIDLRVQVKISGVGRVDLLIGERLVIETDGREWHSDKDSFAKDKWRDLALAERGYLVLRLSYQQVLFESERVLEVVRGIVGRGEHRWNGRHRRAGLVGL
ncbi:endonuclease domain-containing protein [Herbiconiux ginsengi]|uniref:DUF559 domain-containing protein n=1 Tax=Herbiconiux ginsengi TaxID=381665 RepID=A0A1H3PX19_9MICO|nr:DUF559 domain-containing protein [Herbiconiux ginsengi]SDZ05355.1 Protein of unknown function [Herbiconiux ginsengi]